jgi:hypothetical protein
MIHFIEDDLLPDCYFDPQCYIAAWNGNLVADRSQVSRFTDLIFRNVEDRNGWISLRAFYYEDNTPPVFIEPIRLNAANLIDNVGRRIAEAANNSRGAVFCPPLAVFKTKDNAKEANLQECPVLSVELDAQPTESLKKLEALLGPATVIVASGGKWNDEDKLHAHWRLARTTRNKEEHAKLKAARALASDFVKADATAKPAVHPLRWPGSWHTKATPRLTRIVSVTDNEIELDVALAELKLTGEDKTYGASGNPTAPVEDVIAAYEIMANNDLPRAEWNYRGMAGWRASGNHPQAKEAFIKFSHKAPKSNRGDTAAKRWEHYASSPPTKIGFGSMVKWAREVVPDWRPPSWAPSIVPEHDPWAPADTLIERFNGQYAVVNEHGKALIYEQMADPIFKRKVLVRIKFEDLRKLYQNQKLTVQIGEDVVTKTHANWWLDAPKRRQYLGGVVFVASGEAPKDCWNLWQGFAVEPAPGDWSLMKDHMKEVLCAGNQDYFEYLLNTTARMVQFPDRQGEVALVLRGLKGSGKGMFGKMLCKALGQHALHITNAKHLTGQYNAHLRDCIFVFADEAFYAGDKQHEGILKGLITEDSITIEYKFGAVVNVPSFLHVMMASNNDWVVPASIDERRYFTLDVSAHKVGDRAYFNAIHDQMLKRGGLAAMLHELLNHDISQFDFRTVPDTTGLMNQKVLSLPTIDQWLLAVLDRGFVWKSRHGAEVFKEWQEFYTTELLIRSYQQWCAENRTTYPQPRELMGRRLKEIYPAKRPNGEYPIYELDSPPPPPRDPDNGFVPKEEDAADHGKRTAVWQKRPHGFRVGDLATAREQFINKTGLFANRWQDADDEVPECAPF